MASIFCLSSLFVSFSTMLIPTRRGDLEILIYNVIQWLGCTLPWEKDIADPMVVKASKEKHMDKISLFLKACFGKKTPPDAVAEVLKYHKTLDFNTDIDYKKVRKIFEKGLQTVGGSLTGPLVFKASTSPAKRKSNSETPLSGKKMKISRRKLLENCTEDSDEKENVDGDTDEELESELASNKEKIKNETPKRRGRKPKIKKVAEELEVNSDNNDEDNKPAYTAEMKRIMDKMQASKINKTKKKIRTKKQNLEEKREVNPDPSSSTTPVRSRRNRKVINYKEAMEARNNSSDEDEDIVPNSDDD